MTYSEATTYAKTRLGKRLAELGLPAESVDEFVSQHTLVNYTKGAVVFRQGSPADVLFYVLTGLLKVYCPRPDGARIMVNLAGPGDFVGYADFDLRGHPAQVFEVETLTKSSLALFTREHILKVLNTLDRQALVRAIERLNTAWSMLAHWFGTFLGMSFRERLELVLKDLGARFGVRDARGILLTPELAHSDFADMIGSSRPMVTRLMAEMASEGLLARQGKRFLLLEPLADTQASIRGEGNGRALSASGALNGLFQNSYRVV